MIGNRVGNSNENSNENSIENISENNNEIKTIQNIQKIQQNYRNGKTTLVFCHMGQSRSVGCVLLYMMLLSTLQHIQKQKDEQNKQKQRIVTKQGIKSDVVYSDKNKLLENENRLNQSKEQFNSFSEQQQNQNLKSNSIHSTIFSSFPSLLRKQPQKQIFPQNQQQQFNSYKPSKSSIIFQIPNSVQQIQSPPIFPDSVNSPDPFERYIQQQQNTNSHVQSSNLQVQQSDNSQQQQLTNTQLQQPSNTQIQQSFNTQIQQLTNTQLQQSSSPTSQLQHSFRNEEEQINKDMKLNKDKYNDQEKILDKDIQKSQIVLVEQKEDDVLNDNQEQQIQQIQNESQIQQIQQVQSKDQTQQIQTDNEFAIPIKYPLPLIPTTTPIVLKSFLKQFVKTKQSKINHQPIVDINDINNNIRENQYIENDQIKNEQQQQLILDEPMKDENSKSNEIQISQKIIHFTDFASKPKKRKRKTGKLKIKEKNMQNESRKRKRENEDEDDNKDVDDNNSNIDNGNTNNNNNIRNNNNNSFDSNDELNVTSSSQSSISLSLSVQFTSSQATNSKDFSPSGEILKTPPSSTSSSLLSQNMLSSPFFNAYANYDQQQQELLPSINSHQQFMHSFIKPDQNISITKNPLQSFNPSNLFHKNIQITILDMLVLRNCLLYIMRCRPIIKVNASFIAQLRQWEQTLALLLIEGIVEVIKSRENVNNNNNSVETVQNQLNQDFDFSNDQNKSKYQEEKDEQEIIINQKTIKQPIQNIDDQSENEVKFVDLSKIEEIDNKPQIITNSQISPMLNKKRIFKPNIRNIKSMNEKQQFINSFLISAIGGSTAAAPFWESNLDQEDEQQNLNQNLISNQSQSQSQINSQLFYSQQSNIVNEQQQQTSSIRENQDDEVEEDPQQNSLIQLDDKIISSKQISSIDLIESKSSSPFYLPVAAMLESLHSQRERLFDKLKTKFVTSESQKRIQHIQHNKQMDNENDLFNQNNEQINLNEIDNSVQTTDSQIIPVKEENYSLQPISKHFNYQQLQNSLQIDQINDNNIIENNTTDDESINQTQYQQLTNQHPHQFPYNESNNVNQSNPQNASFSPIFQFLPFTLPLPLPSLNQKEALTLFEENKLLSSLQGSVLPYEKIYQLSTNKGIGNQNQGKMIGDGNQNGNNKQILSEDDLDQNERKSDDQNINNENRSILMDDEYQNHEQQDLNNEKEQNSTSSNVDFDVD